jgi:hypothetical protein
MRFVVTYQCEPMQLADGRWTTDSFHVRDTSSSPATTESHHTTRSQAIARAAVLNRKQ